MKLDELKKMIAEEFESYMREEEDQVDVTVGDADVDLDDATGMEGEAGPEEALEQIYNMLKVTLKLMAKIMIWMVKLMSQEKMLLMKSQN